MTNESQKEQIKELADILCKSNGCNKNNIKTCNELVPTEGCLKANRHFAKNIISSGYRKHDIKLTAITNDEMVRDIVSLIKDFEHDKIILLKHYVSKDAGHFGYEVYSKAIISKVQSIYRAKVEKQENPYPVTTRFNDPRYNDGALFDGYERCRQDTLKLLGGK